MKFVETPLRGAHVIDLEAAEDERGFFARSFCADEFAARGLNPAVSQCNISHNKRAGTLRGMHFQTEPHAEAKLVRCASGAIYDVIVDLRPASETRYRWFAVELSAANRRMLYIPEGFAHGFWTLTDDSDVLYQMSAPYHAQSARGLRWNDPMLGIKWPNGDPIMSDRDRNFPLLTDVLA